MPDWLGGGIFTPLSKPIESFFLSKFFFLSSYFFCIKPIFFLRSIISQRVSGRWTCKETNPTCPGGPSLPFDTKQTRISFQFAAKNYIYWIRFMAYLKGLSVEKIHKYSVFLLYKQSCFYNTLLFNIFVLFCFGERLIS